MREVVVRSFCDRHWGGGERVESTRTFTIALDGTEMTLDLCDACAVPVTDVLDMFSFFDTTEKPRRRRGQPLKRLDCVLCDHVSSTRKALATHYVRLHHRRIGDAEREVVPLV